MIDSTIKYFIDQDQHLLDPASAGQGGEVLLDITGAVVEVLPLLDPAVFELAATVLTHLNRKFTIFKQQNKNNEILSSLEDF